MKKWMAVLCLISVFSFHSTVWAAPFPEKTDAIVQDKYEYLDKEEVAEFVDFVKTFPDQYKVVVIESFAPEAESIDEYAEMLFGHYNLNDETMLVVLNMDTEELGVFPGPVFQEKGAKMEMLHDKIASFYGPYRNQREYLKGIKLFIDEVNNEFDRIAELPEEEPAADALVAETKQETSERSIWSQLPWWVYLIGSFFAIMIIGLILAFIRRRSVFAEVDDVEDWKDELVEKIQLIEVDKPLRRAGGTTEERYVLLANRKENLLRMRIPEVEMIILEAEEACDRLRFRMALGLLDEGREILLSIEKELDELKTDSTVVAQTKQENRSNMPEIGKLMEMVERKLTNTRLDYGLSFHELKAQFDQVEHMRSKAKEALAAGDDLAAFEVTGKAQKILNELAEGLDRLPELLHVIQKEMPEELHRLESKIFTKSGTGYELGQDLLDTSLMQVRQIMVAANSALEDGNIQLIETHIKAFSIKVEETYRQLEKTASAPVKATSPREAAAAEDPQIDSTLPMEPEANVSQEDEQEKVSLELSQDERTALWEELQTIEPAVAERSESSAVETSSLEADELIFNHEAAVAQQPGVTVIPEASPNLIPSRSDDEELEPEVEYELVIPRDNPLDDQPVEPVVESVRRPVLLIESEDDVLNEMERISNVLIRLRQQLKRSYLPGIPDEVKFQFEQVVHSLGQVKVAIERYNYRLDEVADLLLETNEELDMTEKLVEQVIANCQLAESSIQYTNRYRRQNRQVNELLTKAEQSFRQLRFKEALTLAEEARDLVEQPEEIPESRWLLRRKKRDDG